MNNYNALIIDHSRPGRKGYNLRKSEVEQVDLANVFGNDLLREEPAELPEVSEHEVVRHFTNLSMKNYGLDQGMYPLGSCTMKYNPKINEEVAALAGFNNIHPLQPISTVQGSLEVMYELQNALESVSGMDQVTLLPSAGSQGELTGLMIIKAYLKENNQQQRNKIIIPDSSHGTNPASASMAGFKTITIPSNENGTVDLEALKAVIGDDTAGFMLTNPNTLGLFEIDIVEIAKMVHDVGGLLYYDGANMNANMGITRPGDMGFDVLHYNLHKTFATPHGGGGPGSGAVGVKARLKDFLPGQFVEKTENGYKLSENPKHTIGKVRSFHGNFGVLLKAYSYILSMGSDGLVSASQLAVLNANYLKESLKDDYILPVKSVCKHEFVFSGLKEANGAHTLDIAKRMMDYGYHPMTIYFPLIVDQAMMIEPTETETKETLDDFIYALKEIAKEARETPEKLMEAPTTTLVRRLDEVTAARKPILTWK
ncbi:MAG: aminomethyl-transferring glycine dehydrogenase subunit GcvPB [Clostridiales bacterium]|nr:aminomethyl-transferring glycine dehydrogenase subunit GcvPB [Clostridiales bacterium]